MASADKQVKILITGENQSDKAFKDAQSGLSGLRGNVTQVAKGLAVFGAAGVAAVTAFGVSALKSFGEAQKAIASMDATLRSMGEAAVENREAILKASEAAVQLGFDDEAAALSITQLYQRTNDLTKAQELSALAMDLSRAKNIDLASATNLVGQVLSGNQRALKQFGIEIDESLGPLAALGELQTKVAGQSEAFAATLPGQMAIMSEAWSNIKDVIGGALAEALMPFIHQFNEWLQNPENVQKIKDIATEFTKLAKDVLPILIDAIKLLYTVWKSIVDVLSEIIFKTMQAIDAIKSLVEAAKGIGKNIGGKVRNIVGGGGGSGGSVNDAIISGGKIITTNPSDYIVATRNPNGMGGGASAVVNIYNPVMLNESMVMAVADQITRIMKRDLRY